MVFFISICDGGVTVSSSYAGSNKTHFEDSLRVRNRMLPNTIDYDDFYKTSFSMGMIGVDEFLSTNNIKIHGSGDSRYLLRADLLRACGQECTGDEGLGKILWTLTIYKQDNR